MDDERYAHVTKEMQAELITSVSEKITAQYDVLARDMVSVVSNLYMPLAHEACPLEVCNDLVHKPFTPNMVPLVTISRLDKRKLLCSS